MKSLKDAAIVVRHSVRVWRAGQLRFRLETFGIYFPALPYAVSWWQAPIKNLGMLLHAFRSYSQWVVQMESVKSTGPESWWEDQVSRNCRPGPDWEG